MDTIGILILTHGDLGRFFVRSAEMILGMQSSLASISFTTTDDLSNKQSEILEALKKVDQGRGAILLTDLFGGTPSNIAISFLNRQNIEVIFGLNLPLLLHLLEHRTNLSLMELVEQGERVGRKYLCRASQFLESTDNAA